MAECIVRLKRIRGAVRGSTTRLLQKIDGELLKPDPSVETYGTANDKGTNMIRL